MSQEEIKNNIAPKKKPDWLTTLESQSWQAELIASGLAIYGTLSIGPHLDSLNDWVLAIADDSVLNFFFYVMFYLYTAHYILVFSFIGHLILRVLWAGFLGLSSVYPNGVNLTKKSIYTKHFLNDVKEEFHNLSDYSIRLDNLCSIIFSILCSVVLFLLSFVIWITIFIFIYKILANVIGTDISKYLMMGIGSLFLSFSIFMSLITTGKFKNSKFAKKYAYKCNQVYSKLLFFIGYKPLSYMLWTIRTNINTKQFIFGMLLILWPAFILVGAFKIKKIAPFKAETYYELNNREAKANASNFLDEINGDRILSPVIQSREIKENYLKLFIPKLKRDLKYKEALCGTFGCDENLKKNEKRKLEYEFDYTCLKAYYDIYIDDNKISNIDFQYQRHKNKNESGYVSYIPIDSLVSGKHVLKITTGYLNEEGEKSVRLIPFFKE